ncbi:hypothetical protein AAC03nite_28670 [Alicyclobacillus acidoterrestris]|nr:hypothetical protein AAC03nite_28670 [Alicyclobacillus acidoterrestris]
MDMGEQHFETVVFSKSNGIQNQLSLHDLRRAVDGQQIKIVNITRHQDQLRVTFRRLLNSPIDFK